MCYNLWCVGYVVKGDIVLRTFVISDIHGELDLFTQLLERIDYDAEHDELILLGDYIDRGPNSKGVLEKVIELQKNGAIVLRGNHEDMLLRAVKGDNKWSEIWLRNGGVETLESYGVSVSEADLVFPDDDLWQKHLHFIDTLKYYYETEEAIFVHAGIDPKIPLEETPASILAWIREDFYSTYDGDKTVVFGHTPTQILHKDQQNNDVFFGTNHVIGIDGGAAFGGQLNCLNIRSRKVTSVSKHDE